MNIIILNGPPFSGKDTLGNRLLDNIKNSIHVRFKDVLYAFACEQYKLPLHTVIEVCNDVSNKDKPSPLFNGLSPRDALIDISENQIKPKYGAGGVAEILCDMLEVTEEIDQDTTLIFTDGGFEVEVEVLMRRLKVAREDLIVIRLVKDGCTYEGDSRSYFENYDVEITNNFDESNFGRPNFGRNMLKQFRKYLSSRHYNFDFKTL